VRFGQAAALVQEPFGEGWYLGVRATGSHIRVPLRRAGGRNEVMFDTMPTALAVLLLTSAPAMAGAPDEDVIACQGKKAGDACVEADGEKGTCQPDEEEAKVLECEDAD
jgi:hypothetical protein